MSQQQRQQQHHQVQQQPRQRAEAEATFLQQQEAAGLSAPPCLVRLPLRRHPATVDAAAVRVESAVQHSSCTTVPSSLQGALGQAGANPLFALFPARAKPCPRGWLSLATRVMLLQLRSGAEDEEEEEEDWARRLLAGMHPRHSFLPPGSVLSRQGRMMAGGV